MNRISRHNDHDACGGGELGVRGRGVRRGAAKVHTGAAVRLPAPAAAQASAAVPHPSTLLPVGGDAVRLEARACRTVMDICRCGHCVARLCRIQPASGNRPRPPLTVYPWRLHGRCNHERCPLTTTHHSCRAPHSLTHPSRGASALAGLEASRASAARCVRWPDAAAGVLVVIDRAHGLPTLAAHPRGLAPRAGGSASHRSAHRYRSTRHPARRAVGGACMTAASPHPRRAPLARPSPVRGNGEGARGLSRAPLLSW